MPNSSLTESQHANLARNQELYSACLSDRYNRFGSKACIGINDPVIHPAVLPVLTLDASLVKLAREKNDGNLSSLMKTLLDNMGPLRGGPPIIHGIRLVWDIRYRTAEELVFLMWYEKIRSLGYRLLTEKAAAELHDRETNISLLSWRENYNSAHYTHSRKISHAVRLVCQHQQIVDGYEHTSYCLDAAYSKKEYKFSILAASRDNSTMQGSWFFKPSSWQKPREGTRP